MAFGRRTLWATLAGLAVTASGVAVAAAGGGSDEAPVETASAPVTVEETVPRLPTTTTTAAPTTTTTTTAAPTTTTAAPTTTTTAPPPAPKATQPPPPPPPPPTTQPPPPPPPPTTQPPPPPPPTANRDTGCEQYMYSQINANRGNALTFDGAIQYIAVNWSDSMSGTQNLAHNPNYGSQIAKHRNYRMAAENVGRGYDTATLFQAFMNSPGHRANIQSGDFSHVTVGCVKDDNGQYWVTQNFWG